MTLDAYAINQPPRQLPGGAPFTIRPPEAIIYDITDGKIGSVWGEKADILDFSSHCKEPKVLAILL